MLAKLVARHWRRTEELIASNEFRKEGKGGSANFIPSVEFIDLMAPEVHNGLTKHIWFETQAYTADEEEKIQLHREMIDNGYKELLNTRFEGVLALVYGRLVYLLQKARRIEESNETMKTLLQLADQHNWKLHISIKVNALFHFVLMGEYEEALAYAEHIRNKIAESDQGIKFQFLSIFCVLLLIQNQIKTCFESLPSNLQSMSRRENILFRFIYLLAYLQTEEIDLAERELRNLTSTIKYKKTDLADTHLGDYIPLLSAFIKHKSAVSERKPKTLEKVMTLLKSCEEKTPYISNDRVILVWVREQIGS